MRRESRIERVLDELAWYQLHRRGREYSEKRPKIACYAYDHISHSINLNGVYEKPYLDVLSGLIDSSMNDKALVDVGANIGNHTAYLAGYFKKVWALEPHPTTFRLLETNAELFSNVTALKCGASDAVATVKAAGSLSNMGSVRVLDRERDCVDAMAGPQVELKLVPLDSITELREGSPVGLIKIDVEGHELSVLKGAASLIADCRPLICFEQNSADISDGSSGSVEFLRSIGYSGFYSIQTGKRRWAGRALPSTLRRAMRLMELFLWEDATQKAVLRELTVLEKIDYPMVIASPEKIASVS